jgi:hypothetical protein
MEENIYTEGSKINKIVKDTRTRGNYKIIFKINVQSEYYICKLYVRAAAPMGLARAERSEMSASARIKI